MGANWRIESLGGVASTLIAISLAASAMAQRASTLSKSPPFLTGSVMGYVNDGMTHLPVRFADILLVPKPSRTGQSPGEQSPAPTPTTELKDIQLVVGSSGFDGRFRLDGVPAGDYLVVARKSAYVTPGASTDVDASEAELDALFSSIPTVHVAPGQVENVNLVLHRGAVITGRAGFADGSPAIGQVVSWTKSESASSRTDLRGKTLSGRLATALSFTGYGSRRPDVQTDDQGRYRLFGLPPGKYVVSTIINLDHNSAAGIMLSDGTGSRSSGREHAYPEIISVFEPGVFARRSARVFEIKGDEQITDADLKIDPDGLHTLKGKIFAAQDRHVPTGAMVQLREEKAKDISRFVEVEDDGSFQFDFLPPGSYMLHMLASDSTPAEERSEPRRYKSVRLAAVMVDHDVMLDDTLMIALKPGEKDEESQF